jgi:repressor LexA
MITRQQRKALLFIEAELERTGGVAPSVREIAAHFNYRSWSQARRLLIGLDQRGFIRRQPGKHRAIEVTRPVSRLTAYRFDPRTKSLRLSDR